MKLLLGSVRCKLLRVYLESYFFLFDQVIIAEWLAWQLATGEVLGSNPGKGKNLLIIWLKRKFNSLNLITILVWIYELTELV